MDTFKIYLCGGMSDLNYKDQYIWRKECKDRLESTECNYKVKAINPCDYYSFREIRHVSEREIFNYDLNHVRTSNLVLTYFNAPNSIGSAIEMFLAKELHIPVIGINPNNEKNIHPWILECVDRMFSDMGSALEYIQRFYLVE